MLPFQTILVPTDFSADAEAATQQAIEIAKTAGARVHLLHVYHLPAYVGSPYGYTYPANLFDDIQKNAAEQLKEVELKVKAEGVEVTSNVVEGPPSERIVEYADRENADLIIIGTRGLTGLKHVFLGSVAERTLRHAGCPVMTVKAPSN